MPELAKQRRYVRRALNVEFSVRQADDAGGNEIPFDSVDISEGGAFLRSDFLLEIGDQLELTFDLTTSGQPLAVRARVAWVTKRTAPKGDAGMGLEFIDLDREQRRIIAEFVHRQVSETQIP